MIFVVALGALAVGGGLILLIARYSPDAAAARAQDQRRQEAAAGDGAPAMPFEQWRQLVVDLLEALGFQVALEHAAGTDLEILARSTEPLRQSKFLVRAYLAPTGDVVEQPALLELHELVKAEGAARGIVLTPYRIAGEPPDDDDAKLELVDGAKLRALIAEHLPDRLAELDAFRGF